MQTIIITIVGMNFIDISYLNIRIEYESYLFLIILIN